MVATLREQNSVVFHDNDFEIFIDAAGCNHNYYELEVILLYLYMLLTALSRYLVRANNSTCTRARIFLLKSLAHAKVRLTSYV